MIEPANDNELCCAQCKHFRPTAKDNNCAYNDYGWQYHPVNPACWSHEPKGDEP